MTTFEHPPLDEESINTVRIPDEPLSATDSWRNAMKRAQSQCEDVRPRAGRCSRTHAGHHRLHLWTDGHVYCKQHYDDRKLGRR